MIKANVKLYCEGNVVSETTIKSNDSAFTESLIDSWTNMFKESKLTLKSLKVSKWDIIEFEIDGTTYTRNYEVM